MKYIIILAVVFSGCIADMPSPQEFAETKAAEVILIEEAQAALQDAGTMVEVSTDAGTPVVQADAGNPETKADAGNLETEADAGNPEIQVDAGNLEPTLDAGAHTSVVDAGSDSSTVDAGSQCGDGVVEDPDEACDDGNENGQDRCNNRCELNDVLVYDPIIPYLPNFIMTGPSDSAESNELRSYFSAGQSFYIDFNPATTMNWAEFSYFTSSNNVAHAQKLTVKLWAQAPGSSDFVPVFSDDIEYELATLKLYQCRVDVSATGFSDVLCDLPGEAGFDFLRDTPHADTDYTFVVGSTYRLEIVVGENPVNFALYHDLAAVGLPSYKNGDNRVVESKKVYSEQVAIDMSPMLHFLRKPTTIDATVTGTTDDDADGTPNLADLCPNTYSPTTATQDQDNDGIGDACDFGDADNDGKGQLEDTCPTGMSDISNDQDDDGCADAEDLDIDGDCHGNVKDNCERVVNFGGFCDEPSQVDDDSDGFGNVCDSCPSGLNGRIAYVFQDIDQDGCRNQEDDDDDGDGTNDASDVCPLNVQGDSTAECNYLMSNTGVRRSVSKSVASVSLLGPAGTCVTMSDSIVWYLDDVITGITDEVFPIANNDDVSPGSVIVFEMQTVEDQYGANSCDVSLNNGYEYDRILVTE